MLSDWEKILAACLALSLLPLPPRPQCPSGVVHPPLILATAFGSQALAAYTPWSRIVIYYRARKAAIRLAIKSYRETPAKNLRNDIYFLSTQFVFFVAIVWVDFHYIYRWTERRPLLEFVPVLILGQLAALVGDSIAQWAELKKKNGSFALFDLHSRRIGNLMGTGLYSAIVDYIVYVVALPAGLLLLQYLLHLHVQPMASALAGALIDIVWISPRLTEPLAYFVYTHYFEGASEEEAMKQIQENGLEVYIYASVAWFTTTVLSLLSHTPFGRFAWISVGILCWNVIFSLKAGENSSLLLERWERHPVKKWFVPFLRKIQSSFERPDRASYLKRWLFVLTIAFVLHKVVKAGIFAPFLAFVGLFALVTKARETAFFSWENNSQRNRQSA